MSSEEVPEALRPDNVLALTNLAESDVVPQPKQVVTVAAAAVTDLMVVLTAMGVVTTRVKESVEEFRNEVKEDVQEVRNEIKEGVKEVKEVKEDVNRIEKQLNVIQNDNKRLTKLLEEHESPYARFFPTQQLKNVSFVSDVWRIVHSGDHKL